MATATQFLNVARSQVGYREGSNNNNKYGIWYTGAVRDGNNWNYQPYCAMGLTWCAAQVSGGLSAIGGHWAYCPSWANWFRNRGRFYSSPQRGDIAFFDWTGRKRRGYEMHVAIVEEVSGSYIKTIEFNTVSGSGNQSDGGGVYKRTRHISLTVGFGRPLYSTELNVQPISNSTLIPLAVDGVWGPMTTCRLQTMLKVSVDGEMGPQTYNALARWLGQTPVGGWSVKMKTALQFRVGVSQDGIIGPMTVRALQRYLNRNVR
jgi:peptidoglycan hydrolase-like protein with peptidoglycan-binding domain